MAYTNKLPKLCSATLKQWIYSCRILWIAGRPDSTLPNLSRLLKIRGLKYIYVLSEFKLTEFFTSHGSYLLNTKL